MRVRRQIKSETRGGKDLLPVYPRDQTRQINGSGLGGGGGGLILAPNPPIYPVECDGAVLRGILANTF